MEGSTHSLQGNEKDDGVSEMKKNVIIVSTSEWDSKIRFRRHHFAERFHRNGWRVLYVNPGFTLLRPFRTHSQIPYSKLLSFTRDIDVSENFKVITYPPGIPLDGKSATIAIMNRALAGRYLAYKARRFFGMEKYVVILYNPFDYYLRLPNACLIVYECVDEWTAYPGNKITARTVNLIESRLVRSADLVTVTAASLREKMQSWRSEIILVPNGVETSIYDSPKGPDCPEDIAQIGHPIIVYVGAITEWFNLSLVKRICSSHRLWNIVLIGPERILSRESLPPNLHYLGTKDWKELPAYLRVADIGIIPFIENALTLHVNPLKLYEYFAAGLTCVSSFMNEIEKYEESHVLEIARNEVDFIAAIDRNLGMKAIKFQRKLSIARAHSWDNIFEDLNGHIMSSYEKIFGLVCPP